MKVIVTGATGMVGEGVLLECLENSAVEQVLSVSRKPYALQHPKLKELLVPDFMNLTAVESELTGYDACLYCAGISSNGMTEADYTRVTYDTAVHFAETLLRLNPTMAFSHVSGSSTDGTEKGRVMWARVKGKTENALLRMPFKRVYNFRPGFMDPSPAQKNVKGLYKFLSALAPVLRFLFPSKVLTMKQVGLAMIHSVLDGAPKPVLEVADIRELAKTG